MFEKMLKPDVRTLVDALEHASRGDKSVFFVNDEHKVMGLPLRDLWTEARLRLGFLQSQGLQQGQELVFQIDNHFDFVTWLWACILGGIIPIPIMYARRSQEWLKLLHVLDSLENPRLLIEQKQHGDLQKWLKENQQSLRHDLSTIAVLSGHYARTAEQAGVLPTIDENALAFIQFSSGSTSASKGVALTHKNIITNIRSLFHSFDCREGQTDILFSWMPLYHDMGIIAYHFGPIWAGFDHYLMVPQLFIRSPDLWLKMIARVKATITVSPNFGYDYFLKRYKPLDFADIDLSHLRIILNGAEPISSNLVQRFNNTMESHGLARTAVVCGYGMAEATLAVTVARRDEEIQDVLIDRKALGVGDRIVLADAGSSSLSVVDVGSPIDDCFVEIRDEQGQSLPEGSIGHIYIQGDNVTAGYYQNPEATRQAIFGNWLKTGDLGFFHRGRLFVTGRSKDVIIVHGANYYAHDIESVAIKHPGVELGKVAICSDFDPISQTEKVLCFLAHRLNLEDSVLLAHGIRKLILAELGIVIDACIQVDKIPKTTSGKLQRFQLRDSYRQGRYDSYLTEFAQQEARRHEQQKSILEEQGTAARVSRIVADVCSTACDPDRNFFEQNITSLQLTRMHTLLAEIFPQTVTLGDIFSYPSITSLAQHIDQILVSEKPGTLHEHAVAVLSPHFMGPGIGARQNELIHFTLKNQAWRSILQLCQDQDIAWEDLVTAFYLYLLAESNPVDRIALSTLWQDGQDLGCLSYTVHPETVDILELAGYVENQRKLRFRLADSDLRDLEQLRSQDGARLLLTSAEAMRGRQYLTRNYCITLMLGRTANEALFTFDVNVSRVSRRSIVELGQKLVTMLETLGENYALPL